MPILIAKEYQPYYRQRGVPSSVLYGTAPDALEDYLNRISFDLRGKPRNISKEEQLKFLPKMANVTKPYLAILSGEQSDTIVQQIALLVCAQMFSQDATKTFYWHTLTGSFKDKLRDDELTIAEVNGCSLLIVSNIAKNSTNVKIEKLKDILELYSHIPRIVIAAGSNPMDIANNMLYTQPHYVLYSNR